MDLRISYMIIHVVLVFFRMQILTDVNNFYYFLGYTLSQIPAGILLDFISVNLSLRISTILTVFSLATILFSDIFGSSPLYYLIFGFISAYMTIQTIRLYSYSKNPSGFFMIFANSMLMCIVLTLFIGILDDSYITSLVKYILYSLSFGLAISYLIPRVINNITLKSEENYITQEKSFFCAIYDAVYTLLDTKVLFLFLISLCGSLCIFDIANPYLVNLLSDNFDINKDILKTCILLGYSLPFFLVYLFKKIGLQLSYFVNAIISIFCLASIIYLKDLVSFFNIKSSILIIVISLVLFSILSISDVNKNVTTAAAVEQNYTKNVSLIQSVVNVGATIASPFLATFVSLLCMGTGFSLNLNIMILSIVFLQIFALVILYLYKSFNVKLKKED